MAPYNRRVFLNNIEYWCYRLIFIICNAFWICAFKNWCDFFRKCTFIFFDRFIIPDDINCYNPTFVNEEGRIDLLIKEYSCPQKFAIIVENKVCGATDQYQQIQRYIEKAEGDDVDTNRIFVIYLTKDGTKDISDYSLTEKAKIKLGITEDNSGKVYSFGLCESYFTLVKEWCIPNYSYKRRYSYIFNPFIYRLFEWYMR